MSVLCLFALFGASPGAETVSSCKRNKGHKFFWRITSQGFNPASGTDLVQSMQSGRVDCHLGGPSLLWLLISGASSLKNGQQMS